MTRTELNAECKACTINLHNHIVIFSLLILDQFLMYSNILFNFLVIKVQMFSLRYFYFLLFPSYTYLEILNLWK